MQTLTLKTFSTASSQSRRRRVVPAIEALEQRIAPATFTVTNTNDSGAGSLRNAILSANANNNPGVFDTIEFNLAGLGPHTIVLQGLLPTINQHVIINGRSNPDFDGRPTVEIDGNGFNGTVLGVTGGQAIFRGLIIGNGGTGVGTSGTGTVQVQGCYIGTDYTGTVAHGNAGAGIALNTANNSIGGSLDIDHNVIAGNGTFGIVINGAAATGNVIRGNFIGTNLLGSVPVPNGDDGISISGGGNNLIGGPAAGEGNVISGNQGDGVLIASSNGNNVVGNIIGLDSSMEYQLQSKGRGIFITGSSANNLIGTSSAGSGNIISGHDEQGMAGLVIIGTGTGNTVYSNIIGTNPSGDDELGNLIGITVSAPGTIIGDQLGHGNFVSGNDTYGIYAVGATGLQVFGNRVGLAPGVNELSVKNGSHGIFVDTTSGATIRANVVGGNGADGIQFRSSPNGVIQGNFLGTNSAGTLSRPNAFSGLAVVFDCPNLQVGGAGAGLGNVISGNSVAGLYIYSLNASIKVQGNLIGTNLAGDTAIPNVINGIHLDGGSHLIGGAQPGQGNVISGNGRGILIESSGNTIQGNVIGLNKAMTAKVANQGNGGGHGILLTEGGDNLIGGDVAGAGNVIAGNAGSGVSLSGAGEGNTIAGNLIGTNAAGAANLGNLQHGVVVSTKKTVIGGDTASERNVISGNGLRGITLTNAADAIVQGNYIGLNPAGTAAVPNLAGLGLGESGTVNTLVKNNVIAGNTQWGIAGTGNSGHVIIGNKIGTNAAGTAAVPNKEQGIYAINMSNVRIGGETAGEGNVISGNAFDAVLISGGSDLEIVNNLVGVNAAGTAAIPNAEGVSLNAVQISINGALVKGNTLAGNGGSGLNIAGNTAGINVESNRVGVLPGGGAMGNGYGISMASPKDVLIGGDATQGNLIAFNQHEGVYIGGGGTAGVTLLSNTVVQNQGVGVWLLQTGMGVTVGAVTKGNTIAQNAGGGLLLAGAKNAVIQANAIYENSLAGVRVTNGADDNLLGGTLPGAGNTIYSNAGPGIALLGGEGTRVLRNVFYGNAGLPIDLAGDGSTANDLGDIDTGPNGLQNAPLLAGAAVFNGSTFVAGSLASVPNTTYRLEFFSGANGTQQSFLGTFNIASNGTGVAPFQFNLGATTPGELISATATNLATGETSEVALAAFVPAAVIDDVTVTEGGGEVNAVFHVTLSSAPNLPVSIDYTTTGGTAGAVDFTNMGGTLTFSGTEQSATITVPITADNLAEAAEKFSVVLSHALNVVVIDAMGEGTIENDDTTLLIDAKGKTATWRDVDGDLVTLKSSRGGLSADDFVFLNDGNGGQQLVSLDLSDDPLAAKTALTFKVKRDAAYPLGDGLVHVGYLNATGRDLASVNLPGDLGRIDAGDATLTTPGLGRLTVGSLGYLGLVTQGGAGSLESHVQGKFGSLVVRGNVADALLKVNGAVGGITLKGSWLGGEIFAAGKMGAVKIGGALAGSDTANPATLASAVGLKSLTVAGEVRFADVLAGYADATTAVNPDASIGVVKVGGNWIASNLVAGVATGMDGDFGTADDGVATAGGSFMDSAKLVSRIARVQIGGYVAGDGVERFGFVAQKIGKVTIGPINYALSAKIADVIALGATGDVAVREVV